MTHECLHYLHYLHNSLPIVKRRKKLIVGCKICTGSFASPGHIVAIMVVITAHSTSITPSQHCSDMTATKNRAIDSRSAEPLCAIVVIHPSKTRREVHSLAHPLRTHDLIKNLNSSSSPSSSQDPNEKKVSIPKDPSKIALMKMPKHIQPRLTPRCAMQVFCRKTRCTGSPSFSKR